MANPDSATGPLRQEHAAWERVLKARSYFDTAIALGDVDALGPLLREFGRSLQSYGQDAAVIAAGLDAPD